MHIEHQPHPGTSTPAWAIASPEYLAKHADCNHAWGACNVKRAACDGCASHGAIVAHYTDCPTVSGPTGTVR